VEALLLVALWLFVITHIDTFVMLVVFCADKQYRVLEVLGGHILGFSAGILSGVAGAALAVELLSGRIALLGLIPLSMGIWGLIRRSPETELGDSQLVSEPTGNFGVVAVAAVGLGVDNVAVYIPFFVGLTRLELGLVVALYTVSAGVLFVLAAGVARRTSAVGIPSWVDRWLVPTVLILVGISVLFSGSILY